jgi:hypothetical protein
MPLGFSLDAPGFYRNIVSPQKIFFVAADFFGMMRPLSQIGESGDAEAVGLDLTGIPGFG